MNVYVSLKDYTSKIMYYFVEMCEIYKVFPCSIYVK